MWMTCTRRTLLACAFALVPLSVFAQGNDTLKIGVSGPFSGGSSPMGESMRNGIRLAAEEINSIGGINGRKIELIERDDQALPEVGSVGSQPLPGTPVHVASQ